MGRTTSLGMALLAGAAITGCSSGSLTRDVLEQQNDTTRALCDCFYADMGYASASACREDGVFPIVGQAITCGDRALSADRTGEVRASYGCLLEVGADQLDCYDAAACDPDAFDACETQYVVDASLCPAPSAAALQAYFDALEDCITGGGGGGGGGGGPVIDVCPEGDLGGATGDAVAMGSTVTGDNDVATFCGGDQANDAAFSWVAPVTGTVTIDTLGSDFDTVLHVFEGTGCAGAPLECDDDGAGFPHSAITLDVTMGDALVIVVDGYWDDVGDYVLNINY